MKREGNTDAARDEIVRARIVSALSAWGLDEGVAGEIAFHLTDWADDLRALARTWERIEAVGDEELRAVVVRFLSHAPNHVAAAKKLAGLGPVEDAFGVGALNAEED